MEAKYKRVLLKISGEALSGDKGYGLDVDTMHKICINIEKHLKTWYYLDIFKEELVWKK